MDYVLGVVNGQRGKPNMVLLFVKLYLTNDMIDVLGFRSWPIDAVDNGMHVGKALRSRFHGGNRFGIVRVDAHE